MLSILLVLQVAQPAPLVEGGPVRFAEKDNWLILSSSRYADCKMVGTFVNGSTIQLSINAADDSSYVVVANDSWKSLRKGQRKNLRFTFLPSMRWAKGQAFVVENSNDDSVALGLRFSDGQTLLKDFRESSSFLLVADGVSLGKFDLSGSREASKLLLTCSAEAASKGASGDPFAPPPPRPTPPVTPEKKDGLVLVGRHIWVQVGAGSEGRVQPYEAYRDLAAKVPALASMAPWVVRKRGWSRLLIGPFPTSGAADRFVEVLNRQKLPALTWISSVDDKAEQTGPR